MHFENSSINQNYAFCIFEKNRDYDRKDWFLMIGWVWYYLPGRYLCVVGGMGVKRKKIIKILQKRNDQQTQRDIDIAINNSAQSSCAECNLSRKNGQKDLGGEINGSIYDTTRSIHSQSHATPSKLKERDLDETAQVPIKHNLDRGREI